ncbi:lectin-like isoform X2 [Rhododendron vialii]|uniref:lectin-like isoform X2 n=1 Tax=Rhododendron vialii TaxID=182163 RepID=UPI00265E5751|nr:lectin-like isoform X2 [Rhododendron vialii]
MWNEDEETTGKDSKGKEIAAGNRRRITRPPLNFLAILYEHRIAVDTSRPDQLCKRLYGGVYLKPNQLKYYVDKKTNKNCFVLYARELIIVHGGNPQYWEWENDKGTSGEDIEVAKLSAVCWIDIKGYIRTINLSPGTLYEIVFEVKKFVGWANSNFSFDLVIKPQHSKALTRTESFERKLLDDWFELRVGEFWMSPEYVGNMEFGLEQHDGSWKSGLVVKCAIIRPKEVTT